MGRIFAVPPTTFDIDHAHALIAGERYAASHGGQVPHNPFWRDLEFRYDRNPDAFAISHRNFKLFFDRLTLNHGNIHDFHSPKTHDWIGCMRGPSPCNDVPCVPVTPSLNSQTIPEPDSIVMASIAVGAWLVAVYVLGRHDSR